MQVKLVCFFNFCGLVRLDFFLDTFMICYAFCGQMHFDDRIKEAVT